MKNKDSVLNDLKFILGKKAFPFDEISGVTVNTDDFKITNRRTIEIDYKFNKIINSIDYTVFSNYLPASEYKLILTTHIFHIESSFIIEINKQIDITIVISSSLEDQFNDKLFEPELFNYRLDFDFVQVINIDFSIPCPTVLGKCFVKKHFTSTSFIDFNSNERLDPKTNKIKNYYTNINKKDSFDIFDLILPTLQPPLGQKLNNSLSFFKELYKFQVEGINFLVNSNHALLGDEMGLGKSIQAINATRILFRKGKIKSACIICPKAVLSDWTQKLNDWAPELKVLKIEGDKLTRKSLWNTPSHVFVCTYEIILQDLGGSSSIRKVGFNEKGHAVVCPNKICCQTLNSPWSLHYKTGLCPKCGTRFIYPDGDDIAKTYFDLIIFDEIQKIKNSHAKTTRAVRSIYAENKWALSGTPLENKIEDLISICETIKPNIFKNIHSFETNKIIDTYKTIFKRRRKEDVLKELPKKTTEIIWLKLSPTQRRKYDSLEIQGINEINKWGESITIHHILALITKLKQICNIDRESGESSKLDYLEYKLEELTDAGNKALVFSQYPNETLQHIKPKLSKFNPVIYDGSLSDSRRTTIVNEFQKDISSCKVLLLSLKAGNSGITLTKANYVYHFDLWWNPAISKQAVGRAHRIGQDKPVFECIMLTENTIEEKIYKIIKEKEKLFEEVVDNLSDSNPLQGKFTEDEIFGLFGLKKQRKTKQL